MTSISSLIDFSSSRCFVEAAWCAETRLTWPRRVGGFRSAATGFPDPAEALWAALLVRCEGLVRGAALERFGPTTARVGRSPSSKWSTGRTSGSLWFTGRRLGPEGRLATSSRVCDTPPLCHTVSYRGAGVPSGKAADHSGGAQGRRRNLSAAVDSKGDVGEDEPSRGQVARQPHGSQQPQQPLFFLIQFLIQIRECHAEDPGGGAGTAGLG